MEPCNECIFHVLLILQLGVLAQTSHFKMSIIKIDFEWILLNFEFFHLYYKINVVCGLSFSRSEPDFEVFSGYSSVLPPQN